ncbi:hypothetical protein AB0F17_61890 [Nonomuraea sp. NPDC026600]|uniref:hypothetical protein n=1 Tax=Nonomuraea sp. NPDC026600 TaxID=3155363 RepID=UPI0033DD7973
MIMIIIAPPLPLTDIHPASPHLTTNLTPGRLVPVDVVFHLDVADGHQIATALKWIGPDAGELGNPVAEVEGIIRRHPRHTFAGTITFPAVDGEPFAMTANDGVVTGTWQLNPRKDTRA